MGMLHLEHFLSRIGPRKEGNNALTVSLWRFHLLGVRKTDDNRLSLTVNNKMEIGKSLIKQSGALS